MEGTQSLKMMGSAANRNKRIVISGTYGTGKTTTTKELSRLTGIPPAVARGMREILPEAFPGKNLEECTPHELVQLGLTRFGERCAHEAGLKSGFISDGSALHEWAYGHGRMLEGAQGEGSEIFGNDYQFAMDAYGEVAKRHAAGMYTDVIHLPVEFPLPADGHRPVSEKFRNKADEILLKAWEELGFSPHLVGGSIDERITKIANLLNLSMSPTLQGPEDRGNGKLWYAQADDALGSSSGRFFSNGFRNVQHDIYDIHIDPNGDVIQAKVDLSYVGNWSLKNGEAPTPHFSSIDSVLTAGQLTQMLMYAQDGITRDESNNLWLRGLEIKPGKCPIENVAGIPAQVSIVKSCKPRMGCVYWHAADIEADFGDGSFGLSAKVAYELPERLHASARASRRRAVTA